MGLFVPEHSTSDVLVCVQQIQHLQQVKFIMQSLRLVTFLVNPDWLFPLLFVIVAILKR